MLPVNVTRPPNSQRQCRGRCAAILLFLLAVNLIPSHSACSAKDQPPRPILILYAFSAEGDLLAEKMSGTTTVRHLGRTVRSGQIDEQPVVLVEAGMGMTNAAMTTQHMIDQYHPQAVIMTGIAGGIDDTVDIGDIVVCAEWIQHDYGYEGNNGFEPSELSVYVPRQDSLMKVLHFLADGNLLAAVRDIDVAALALEKIGSRHSELLIGGVGVSGNSFIDSKEKRLWLSQTFSAWIVDMESAAVAHVCTANDIPFIVFRSASDLAGGSGSETAAKQLEDFFKIAANNSSKVVIGFLKEL